ncbi:sulfotransferase [Nocardioides sp.]|jgi:hypothetical protein|uniref:sulfotransferase family protein n=1 Tax=Nocardioides sp. TaxID=35761 RepID=UPI0026380FB8|nr:sulfotransferase [Nocardioides sp.]
MTGTREHELLFVAGVARSGTTALRRILGNHPDIAVGMERYKRLWGERIGELGPEHFERDRFFDYRDGLTNITPDVPWAQERLADLEAKWDTARYRGDKMTAIRARKIWQRFPQARFVFIVRDISLVASSWERRAADASDTGWREGAGADRAVGAWNTAVRRVLDAVSARPEQAIALDYTRFFGEPSGAGLAAAMAFLDLDAAPIQADWQAAHDQYVESVAGRDRTLPPETAAYIAEHADLTAWRRLGELTV